MNKPLTIDELKALKVGDWVWVEVINVPNGSFRGYYQIRPNAERSKLIFCGIEHDYSIMDYGTKWLAYKNKEQAECKGEIVELPCHWGDTVYFIDHKWGKDKFEWVDVKSAKFDWEAMRNWNDLFFATREEAELRLAELKGEK